ncbi:MAG: hypothetical protein ACOZJZ_14665 [Pseudomonadota bacterium]
MSIAHEGAVPQGPCRNCGTAWPAPARYCAQCGQETALHPPTLGEFVHEFVVTTWRWKVRCGAP